VRAEVSVRFIVADRLPALRAWRSVYLVFHVVPLLVVVCSVML
jgi:hypothetical protein